MGVILLHQRRFRETWGVLEIAGGEYWHSRWWLYHFSTWYNISGNQTLVTWCWLHRGDTWKHDHWLRNPACQHHSEYTTVKSRRFPLLKGIPTLYVQIRMAQHVSRMNCTCNVFTPGFGIRGIGIRGINRFSIVYLKYRKCNKKSVMSYISFGEHVAAIFCVSLVDFRELFLGLRNNRACSDAPSADLHTFSSPVLSSWPLWSFPW